LANSWTFARKIFFKATKYGPFFQPAANLLSTLPFSITW
jgi:hypothetical protein